MNSHSCGEGNHTIIESQTLQKRKCYIILKYVLSITLRVPVAWWIRSMRASYTCYPLLCFLVITAYWLQLSGIELVRRFSRQLPRALSRSDISVTKLKYLFGRSRLDTKYYTAITCLILPLHQKEYFMHVRASVQNNGFRIIVIQLWCYDWPSQIRYEI